MAEENGHLKGHLEGQLEGRKLKKFKLNDKNEANSDESTTAEVDLNPFLLEPVLRVLMKSMSITDLKATRLVSNFWDEMSLEQLKIKLISSTQQLTKKLKLQAGFEYNRFYQQVKNHQLINRFDIDFSQYLKTIQENPSINIFEDFEIIDLALVQNDGEIISWKEVFYHLKLTSKSLQNLVISLYFDYSRINDRKLDNDIMALSPEFTILKKLTFFQAGSNGNLIRNILSSILKNMPKLQCFKTDIFPENQQLVDIILDPSSTNGGPITKLEVSNWTNSNDQVIIFKTVQIMHLKVKILKINKSNTSLYTSMNNFLQCQSPLIESLSLEIEVYVESPIKIVFPIFDKITKLALNEFHFTCCTIASDLVPFNFEQIFPNLVELRVNKCDYLYGNRGSKTLKTLSISSYSTMKIKFTQLELMFPNIESFETNDCMLRENGDEIPWGSKLEKLKLSLKTYQFMYTAKLAHLKRLRILDIEYFYQVFLFSDSDTNRLKMQPNYCQDFIESFNSLIKMDLEIIHVNVNGFGLKKSELPEFKEKAIDPVEQKFSNTRTKILFSY